ncbi:MAG TPA: fibronectin type III-like domain-contianing protein [Gemmatimonadaceae bacterium]|nr:fibronectin type III-like domain-contianing protein [Gemmatimonadaceae bacterium]
MKVTNTPAMRRLARFRAIDLAPGASQGVTFTLTKGDLAPAFEPGDFDVMVGNLTRTFTVGP